MKYQPITDYVAGLDPGKINDPAALALLEVTWGQRRWDRMRGRYVEEMLKPYTWRYNVVHLERFRLDTPYPKLVKLVKRRIREVPIAGLGALYLYGSGETRVHLVVDSTGVGVSVVDMLRDVGLDPIALTITGGNEVARVPGGYHVPKRDLVGHVVMLLQNRQLKVAASLREAETLRQELKDFRYKISESGHDSYSAAEGSHDDVLMATSMGCWYAERIHHNTIGAIDDDIAEAWENFTGI